MDGNGNIYEGDWKEGNKKGEGRFITFDGDIYEGEFNEGKLHGEGTLVSNK